MPKNAVYLMNSAQPDLSKVTHGSLRNASSSKARRGPPFRKLLKPVFLGSSLCELALWSGLIALSSGREILVQVLVDLPTDLTKAETKELPLAPIKLDGLTPDGYPSKPRRLRRKKK